MAVHKMGGVAKVTRPRFFGLYPRVRLFRRLDRLRRHSALWVCGSPGAGKTALVAGYIEARRLRHIWFTVDSGDTDIGAFFAHLRLAARGAARRPGLFLPLMRPEYAADIAGFSRRVFRELFRHLPAGTVLVFDNWHEAAVSRAFVAVTRSCLAEIPKGISVIVISRGVPPSALARLQVVGELIQLDSRELLLTEAEAAQMASLRAAVPRRLVRALHERSAGWAAAFAVMLSALDKAGEPRSPAAPEDNVEALIATELFEPLKPPARRVLLTTAFLPRFNAAMAVAMSEEAEAARILKALYQRRSLMDRRGDTEPVYSYHPLLRGFLLRRAEADYTASMLRRLRLRAAGVLTRAGHLEESVAAYLELGRWNAVASVLNRLADKLLAEGRHQTVAGWISGIPPERVEANGWLLFWRGSARTPFDPPGGRADLERAYRLFKASRDGSGLFLAWSAIVAIHALEWADFSALDPWLRESQWLRRTFGPPSGGAAAGAFTASMFAALMCRQPDHADISVWADRLNDLVRDVPDDTQRLLIAANLYTYWAVVIGDHLRARRLLALLEEKVVVGSLPPLAAVIWWTLWAQWAWQTGRTREASEAVDAGLVHMQHARLKLWDFLLPAQKVYARLTDGDAAGGRRLLDPLRPDGQRQIETSHYMFLLGHADLLDRDAPAALRHTRLALESARRFGGPQQQGLARLAHAQALQLSRRPTEAAKLLRETRRAARRMRSPLLEFQTLVVTAHAALVAATPDAAEKLLAEAFALAARHDYVNHFYFDPEAMARLAAVALEADIEPEYVTSLIGRRGLRAPERGVLGWPAPIKVTTLGRFVIEKDGRVLAAREYPQPVPRALLQVLLALGQPIAATTLRDLLRLEARADDPLGSVRVNLHRLRKRLGRDDAVRHRGMRVELDWRACWVDAWAFERTARRLQSELRGSGGGRPRIERLLRQCLTLYQGPFLPDCADGWAEARRGELRTLFLAVVLAAGARRAQAGRWESAIELYRAALAREDTAAELSEPLAEALLKTGRVGEPEPPLVARTDADLDDEDDSEPGARRHAETRV